MRVVEIVLGVLSVYDTQCIHLHESFGSLTSR